MSNIDILADNLANEIVEALQKYGENVADDVKKGVDKVGKETNEEIKKHITFKQPTGKYVKAFRLKTVFEDRNDKRITWHVANGEHRLTHLLENGHALRQGGRAKAYPHIKYGEELAIKRMEEVAKEAIKNGNGH